MRDLCEEDEGDRRWRTDGVGDPDALGRGEPGAVFPPLVRTWDGTSLSGQGNGWRVWTGSRRRCFQRPRGRLREGTGGGAGGKMAGEGDMKASMRGEAGGEDGHTEEGEENRAGEGYISLRGLTPRLRSMGSMVHVQSRPGQLIPAPSAHRLPPNPVQPIATHPISGPDCRWPLCPSHIWPPLSANHHRPVPSNPHTSLSAVPHLLTLLAFPSLISYSSARLAWVLI